MVTRNCLYPKTIFVTEIRVLPLLSDEHAVAVAVESVLMADGLLVGFFDQIEARECRYQHEKCGTWKMEIGQKLIDDLEFISWMNEEVGRKLS
jgi:hypothetical protein